MNFKWAWQAQFLSCIPQILKKYVFFRTRRARQPAEGRLARRWPKATGVGAAAFSKMLDAVWLYGVCRRIRMYGQPELDTPQTSLVFLCRIFDMMFADALGGMLNLN